MSNTIDYYFTTISPFTWFGHNQLCSIAKQHNKIINFKPISLADVWAVSGAVPPAQRPPVRQRYRLIELQRTANFRGKNINIHPAHFPTDPTLADNCISAIQAIGEDPADFTHSLGEAVWSKELQIADEAIISGLLKQTKFDAALILDHAKSGDVAKIRTQNSKDAISADVIGAPAYVYEGEVFWGQDRLDYLDHMITSGRSAFTAN